MKRKFSLFLNIATLVLCVCAIAFGVYSAKNASLNVGGQIGFVAHDCKVQFEGEIEGAVLSTDTDVVKNNAPKLYIQSGNNAPGTSAPSTPITIDGGASTVTSLSFGNLKFALDNDHEPYPIKFTFKVTNLSAFDVCASLNLTEFNVDPSITYTANEYKLKLGTAGATKSNTFTITLTAGSASITNSPTSKINLSFEKFNVPIATEAGYTIEDWNLPDYQGYSISGVPEGSGSLTIPAYFRDETTGDLIRIYSLWNDDSNISGVDNYSNIIIGEGIQCIWTCTFEDLTNLRSITLSGSVIECANGFDGCTELSNVCISANLQLFCLSSNTAYVTNATSATNYVYDNIIYITDKLDGSGNKLVACRPLSTEITSATIANTTKVIAGSAFYNCTGLTSITIPSSVTSIGSSAFYGCSSLTSITIPDGVTSIGGYAFRGCSSLTTITIPSSVTSIGWGAFYDCTDLNSLTFAETKTWEYSSYSSFPSGSTSTVTLTAGNNYKDYFTDTSGTYRYKFWRVQQ